MTSTVVQAGKYRHRVTIQRPIQVQDSTGAAIPDWEDIAVDVRAAIESLSGREFMTAQQVQADVTTKISFRWRPHIDATMRILHVLDPNCSPEDVEVYNIEYALPDETGRKEIVCYCRIRLNQGFRSDG